MVNSLSLVILSNSPSISYKRFGSAVLNDKMQLLHEPPQAARAVSALYGHVLIKNALQLALLLEFPSIPDVIPAQLPNISISFDTPFFPPSR